MQLSIEEVKKLDSNSYQIIDIRSEEEVAHGAIKGALNIQAEEIESDERVLHDKKLVIVCSRGKTSVDVAEYLTEKGFDAAKSKLAPTAEELYPNMKFVENKFVSQLEVNKQLMEFAANQKRSWANDEDFIKGLYDKIIVSDIYKEYMASSDKSYEVDRELWRKLYKAFVFNNEELDVLLEDQSLYWNDDKEIVDTFVLKTIKRFEAKNGANQTLLPEFKDEEDQEFARRLFRRAILNCDYYRHLISENTRNWDLDRVAFMDVIIMQCALAEILSFPNIPVSVSLNEYVEIAKVYSTIKSGSFVNGTLDGIVNQLKKEGKLAKN